MELDEEIEEYNRDLEFKKKIDEIVKKKIKEGYFVRNPDWVRKLWNNFMFGALAPGRYIEWIGGYKGGQCGEFCDWGKGWVNKSVKDSYGDGAIITDITMNEEGWRNHASTRVILPDGRRIVIDFWESIHKGHSCIYTEKQWIDKYKKLVGGPVTRSDLEKELKTYVEQLGMEEGTKWYVQSGPKKPYINTLVKSYKRDPW
jgi:hypothetical protein